MAEQIDLGALIIQIRAESAQFQAEMDGARQKLGQVGESGHGSAAGIAHLAKELVSNLVPGFDITTKQITLLIRTAQSADGILGNLAKAGAAIGAAGIGYALGNAVRNFIDLREAGYGILESMKLAVGSTKAYEEALKKANEEQEKFTNNIAEARKLQLENAKTLNELQGKNLASALGLAGNAPGAAAATRDTALKTIEIEKKLADQALADAAKSNEKIAQERAARQLQIDQITAAKRLGVELKYQEDLKKIREDENDKQLKLWQSQTEFLVEQFKTRVKYREDFERGLGQGNVATGEGVAGGFGAAFDLTRQAQDEVRKLAGLRKLGQLTDQEYFEAVTQVQQRAYIQAQKLYDTWYEFPAVMRAIGQSVDALSSGGFSPLNDEMNKATESTTRLLSTNKELAEIQSQIVDQFTRVPQATGTAGVAVQKLANDYNDLAVQAAGATQQIYSAAAAMVYFHSVGG